MPRSVNAVAARARRKKVLKQAKGFYGRRKNVWTVAKNAVEKAMQYAYRGRKEKKRNFRALWITRINAGTRENGISYSQFMGALKKNNIELNRKVLADLAKNQGQPKCPPSSGFFIILPFQYISYDQILYSFTDFTFRSFFWANFCSGLQKPR